MASSPLPRGDQADQVASRLRALIISGELPAGTRLGQAELAIRFNVSRMPIREALQRLANDGFVEVVPNSGARVAPLTIDDLAELSEMRVAAETLALSRAIPNLSDAQIDLARTAQAQSEAAPAGDFGLYNARFHQILYEPCARPRLLDHIERLTALSERYLLTITETLDYTHRSDAEHHQLIEACQARDIDAATRCLTRHIENAATALAHHLRED